MKLKKFAAMLFTLCLIVAMMPLAVFADDDSEREGDRWGKDLYILGRKIEASGEVSTATVPHTGTITYDKDAKALTLDGATIDLKDYSMPGVTNNYVAAISASDNLTIVLKGNNQIINSSNHYDDDKAYVYGIKNSGGDTTISGNTDSASDKLKIELNGDGTRSFTGIDAKRMLTISKCSLEVSIGGEGANTGIDLFGDFGIDDHSEVKVNVNGSGSTGVNGTGMFDGSYVVGGSTLEMTAAKSAFRCYLPSESLKNTPAVVNADAAPAETPWNNTDPLANFRYVKFTAAPGSSPERAYARLYLLGRKVTSNGDIVGVPHSGDISYDEGSNTLTLEKATLDLKNNQDFPGGNLIAAIYGTSDINIVLKGENTIKFTNEKYGETTEYAYGIESWGKVNISGAGTLNIALSDAIEAGSNPDTRIYGIGADDEVNVDQASVNIKLGDKGRATGMYLWGPVNLTGGAVVIVTAKGENNIAVNGVNDIAKSTVSADSVFEMTADNIAFNCWSAGDGLKEAGAMVNKSASPEGASVWNKKEWLREYKYVRFPEDDPDVIPVPVTNEFTITYDLNGGTLNEKTGRVTEKFAAGTVITLPLPERAGYEFDYWEGSKYNAGDKYTVSKDHTFKAIWKSAEATDTGSKDKGKSSGVKTGDDSTLYAWIVLMVVSVIGLAGVAAGRKRPNRNR